MLWLNILGGLLITIPAGCVFYYFILKNKMRRKTARWLTLAVISLGLCLMQFYGSPHYLAYVFENKIKSEDPIFILLSQKDTAHFYAYLHKVKDSFLDHNSSLVPYYTGQYIYSELVRNSPHATPISFYYLAKATVDLYQKIYAQNPSLVLSLEFNLPAASFYIPMDYNQAIDPIFDAKKLIIESALTDPQPALSQNDKNRAQIILQRIMMRLSSNYGDNVVSTTFKHPGDPNLDQKIAAEIIIQFYQMILDRGKDDAGLVIKYIFTTANYQS